VNSEKSTFVHACKMLVLKQLELHYDYVLHIVNFTILYVLLLPIQKIHRKNTLVSDFHLFRLAAFFFILTH
jgi:hypothetical protein